LIGAVLPVASRKRVTVCFTGTPTSTFGGGGGTKLFCSQAVNATNGNMTMVVRKKELRKPVAAVCRWAPAGLAHLGERASFITEPHSFYSKQGVFRRKSFRDAINSNNPLAVEPETENDLAGEDFP
jgi:hypothetical protein